ncbi:MAG: NADH-quinone oxidoreductase subunit L [Acidobacteriota bacterium]
MLRYLWLIPILPLLGFLVNGLFGLLKLHWTGRRPSRPFVYWTACGTVLLAFLLSAACVLELSQREAESQLFEVEFFHWIPGNVIHTDGGATAALDIAWNLQLDPLSAIMILFVSGIGFLIHVYSIGYMWDEEGFYRYFAFLNLFMFMMLTLVLAGNYLVLFVGWEGVGLCSYLLIGYYLDKKSAGDAAKKAFVVNRVGDFGFIIGVFLIFAYFGTLDFTDLFAKVQTMEPETATWGVLSWIALLLFIGATGKSAQAPLYVWLPDAMEGPTPVSALIHAATMVTAGVYMVARSAAIFSRAPAVSLTVAVIGIFTALLAASIGLFQRDIKRVLAYSTVSQLGYMFTALGVGAVAAGIFHVFTHAFFKALLFLGSGSVIQALHHEQDMMKMGGLRKQLPITWATMGIATLAIAGFPPFAGFFSKDEILWKTYSSGHILIWIVGALVAAMTAFYMFRLMFLTFHGQSRAGKGHAHAVHESPLSMTVPLVILAAGSAVAGFLGMPAWLGTPNLFEHFLEPALSTAYQGQEGHAIHASLLLEVGLAGFSILLAGAGLVVAYRFFIAHKEKAEEWRLRFQNLHELVFNKYYVDEAYDLLFVHRAKGLGSALSWFDATVVDGLVNGSALMTRITAWVSGQADLQIVDRMVNLVAETVHFLSSRFRRLQTGLTQRYALFFVLGIILVITFYLYYGV